MILGKGDSSSDITPSHCINRAEDTKLTENKKADVKRMYTVPDDQLSHVYVVWIKVSYFPVSLLFVDNNMSPFSLHACNLKLCYCLYIEIY